MTAAQKAALRAYGEAYLVADAAQKLAEKRRTEARTLATRGLLDAVYYASERPSIVLDGKVLTFFSDPRSENMEVQITELVEVDG